MKLQRKEKLAWNVAGVVLFIAVWEGIGQWLGSRIISPPSVVAVDYVQLLKEGVMLRELMLSLRQMLVGFGVACAFGMPLGVLMGRYKTVEQLTTPWIGMFVVTSVASLVPLLILLLGTGFALRATIVFLASVWYIVITTYNGTRGIDPGLLAVARSFGASQFQTASKVVLPALFPYLIAGARIGLVHAIRAMVVAEMFIILGYGGLIYQTGLMAETGPLVSLLISLMLVSVGSTWLLRVIGRIMAPWYEQQTAGA